MYGEKYMTINIHYLLNLSSDVQNLGPLWAHSCFLFENLNGELKHMFHGSRYIDTQILNALCVAQQLPKLLTDIRNIPAKMFVSQLSRLGIRYCMPQKRDMLMLNFLGKQYSQIVEASISRKLPNNQLQFYRRIRLHGQMIHSMAYEKDLTDNSYTVKYLDTAKQIQFGFVCWFAESVSNKQALIKRLSKSQLNLCHTSFRIWNILPSNFKSAISLDEFKSLIKTCNGPNWKYTACDMFTWF